MTRRIPFCARTLLAAAFIVAAAGADNGRHRASAQGGGVAGVDAALVDGVGVAAIREVVHALVAPEMSGRRTGSPGAARAADYLAGRFARAGLSPLGDTGGSYVQRVPVKSPRLVADASYMQLPGRTLPFAGHFTLQPAADPERHDIRGEVTFVGYGLVAPETRADHLAGVDLAGRIVIVLADPPPAIGRSARPADVTTRLIQRGAAAVIVAEADAARPFGVIAAALERPQVFLDDPSAAPAPAPPILLASRSAVAQIFATARLAYDESVAAAARGERVTRSLGISAALSIRIQVERATALNVAGVVIGADPQRRTEAVVHTAHYDALGVDADGRLHAGAADNALGVGMLVAQAETLAGLPWRPGRSVVFMALTGEEDGQIGARYWLRHPTWPAARIAANLNFDGVGTEVYGPPGGVVGFGAEYSELGVHLAGAAAALGYAIVDDPLPEARIFQRSDHYAFAQAGIPALMLMGLPIADVPGVVARAKTWIATAYHREGDVVQPDWNWEGARGLAALGLLLGLRVADDPRVPAWRPSAPFSRRATESIAPRP